jgi:secreted trypsin-like serine protease
MVSISLKTKLPNITLLLILHEDDDRYSPDNLMEASFFTISRNACLKTSGSWAVHESNICASLGARGICLGDLGGPLMFATSQGYTQIGIGSEYVYSTCVSVDQPQFYSNVAYFASWIDENICKFSTDKPKSCSTAKPTKKPNVRKSF